MLLHCKPMLDHSFFELLSSPKYHPNTKDRYCSLTVKPWKFALSSIPIYVRSLFILIGSFFT
uniref:Uncharacterized protein n=1 Tax=Arundo donax TaxID=35708 RepID=A0A0A8Z0F8_ARUDO